MSKDDDKNENTKSPDENGEDQNEEEKNINLTFDVLRVAPPQTEVDKNPRTDRLTDLLIILFIFGISTWFRWVFRGTFLPLHLGNSFNIIISESDPFGFGAFLGLEPGSQASSEGYGDYSQYYLPYVSEYADGWNPYTGSIEEGDSLGGYVYGPYYIISISLGHMFFDLGVEESINLSNIMLDAGTYVMVYILAKRVTGNVVAMLFALVGSFSPISLFFIAYKGLNAPIMNFSFLLFVWFLMEKHDTAAGIMLAFSALTKQFPLLYAMPYGFFMFRRHGFLKGASFIILFILFFFLFSIPYILITPYMYFIRLFLAGGSYDSIYCPSNGQAPNLAHGSIPYEACGPGFQDAGAQAGINNALLPSYSNLLFNLVNSHVLFFGSIFIIAWIGFTGYQYFENNEKLYFIHLAAYYSIAHATIARGIYKYYLTFLIPLLILGFVVGNREKSLHLRLGAFLKNSWSDWFDPKFRQKEATLTFWLYFVNLLVATAGVFWALDMAISLFTTEIGHYKLWMIITSVLAIAFIIRPSPEEEMEKNETTEPIAKLPVMSMITFVIVAVGSIYLVDLAELFFGNDTDLLENKLIITLIFVISFLLLSYTNNLVTRRETTFKFINIHYFQLILDIIGILIVFSLLRFFHIMIFTLPRFRTTPFLFMFSFIPMALLGQKVWKSGFTVPSDAIDYYLKLRRKVNIPSSGTAAD